MIPCIDIMDGECVQLVGGKAETKRSYGDPFRWLEEWSDAGADLVHVIDLDATLGKGSNKDTIMKLIKTDLSGIQVGGGIGDLNIASEYVNEGAKRIIVGSKALDGDFMITLRNQVGQERIMAALDTRGDKVAVNGWQTLTAISAREALTKVLPCADSILATNVDREGLLGGSDVSSASELTGFRVPVYVSGGFTTIEDLKDAESMGFAGVVVGRALFEGRLDLEELW